MTTVSRTYACGNCGHPFTAYPPDDIHTIVRLQSCEQGHSVQVTYECEKCRHGNIRHWDEPHTFIASVGRGR